MMRGQKRGRRQRDYTPKRLFGQGYLAKLPLSAKIFCLFDEERNTLSFGQRSAQKDNQHPRQQDAAVGEKRLTPLPRHTCLLLSIANPPCATYSTPPNHLSATRPTPRASRPLGRAMQMTRPFARGHAVPRATRVGLQRLAEHQVDSPSRQKGQTESRIPKTTASDKNGSSSRPMWVMCPITADTPTIDLVHTSCLHYNAKEHEPPRFWPGSPSQFRILLNRRIVKG